MKDLDIYGERRNRINGNCAVENLRNGRYVFTVGPFENALPMLIALEGEGIDYKLLRCKSGARGAYYELHPYDGSAMSEIRENRG